MSEHGVGIERREELLKDSLFEWLDSVGGVDRESVQHCPDGASNAPLEDPNLGAAVNSYSYSTPNIILCAHGPRQQSAVVRVEN
jgi:hypothetical protein